MKIVLIDPKGLTSGLNSGLGYLSSALEDFEVETLDFNNMYGNEKKRLELAKNADIIGISIKSFTLNNAVKLASELRNINKNALIVAGGPHITIDGHNFMKENGSFDMSVFGEGEKNIADVASGKDKKKINGLLYRDGGKIVCNAKNPWIEDINKLPFPDYSIFDSVKAKSGIIEDYPLVTSRGCPYQCTYCSVGTVIGKKWRTRSPENIIKELESAKNKYSSKKFRILDDDFTLDMKRAKELCQMMIDEKISMHWSCPNGIRADRLDEELISLMKDSGCYSISLGIESLVPDVFERITKGEKIEDIKHAVSMIKNADIGVNGFFIIGLPGSTYKKDRETMKEAKKLKLDSASWGILVPYPGTKIWKWVNSDKSVHILRDWKEGFHVGFKPKPVFETDDYKVKERVKAYRLANLMFMGRKGLASASKLFFKGLVKRG